MNIERINLNNIPDPETRQVVSQLAECVFELNRELKRTLNQLTSQNVKEIDFNVTKATNIDKALEEYAKTGTLSEFVTAEVLNERLNKVLEGYATKAWSYEQFQPKSY